KWREAATRLFRASARFARAALAIQQGDTKTATETYKSIAAESSLPQPYRDAALVRQPAREFARLQPQEVIARLAPLAKPGEPWFGSAGEMTALALAKQGTRADAGPPLAHIANDTHRTRSIR